MDARITGRDEAVAGCEGQRRTLPIGDDATGAFDDRRQCKVVEHIKRDIYANIDTPRGDLGIGHAASAIDGPAGRRLQPLERGPVITVIEIDIAGRQHGLGEILARPGADRRAVA